MRPLGSETAFVLAGGPGLPVESLGLLDGFFTIGVDLGQVEYEPSVMFDAAGVDSTGHKAAAAARWALRLGCRPVCLVGVDVSGPGRADLLELLAGGSVWLWPYRGATFEHMVTRLGNRQHARVTNYELRVTNYGASQ